MGDLLCNCQGQPAFHTMVYMEALEVPKTGPCAALQAGPKMACRGTSAGDDVGDQSKQLEDEIQY